MAAIPERFHEPLQFAANELMELLRAENPEHERLVQKGLMLFRQGLVYQLRFDGDEITATVQDVTPAKVQLNLNFIQISTCSCPADEFCRHQMAVFFQLLSHARSVSTWVEEWRKPLRETKVAKQLGIQKAKDLLQTAGRQKPNYDRWIAAFDESFQTILEANGEPKPYVITELYKVYTRRMKANAPYEQEWKLLYFLVGHVFSFKKLMGLSVKYGHSAEMIHRYYKQLFYEIADDVVEVISSLSVHSLPFAFDEFIEKLKEDSTGLITADFPLEFERIHLYRTLWTKFFKKKEWCQKELKKLRAMGEQSHALLIGTIHLHFLQKEDEIILEQLALPDKWMTPFITYWIELLSAQKDWKRVAPFIELYIKKLRDYLSGSKDYYEKMSYTKHTIKTIKPYCTEANRHDLYEKALIEMLPYSYNEYEYLLFDNEAFERWTDLQAYMGLDIERLASDRIKELEKQQPHLLLPLYHQSVQDHIAQKGRDNYRQAVRKMKKLRTLYKKLKRQDDWVYYLEALLEKTKRLRAFQEECKRGKLIDA
ncbi:SWIM zinc finger family protein [Cytobacillus praedii]|uniref:SWIM zinc finger family protein n=1 Tax=Cytobacillus praedii TaxID=1742358 RepID=UPI002E23A951|nr:SWIM zinc finger family protein [Cytobacillus praedii]